MENLQSQNTKLIEKVESLTQKSNNLEGELIKMQTYKTEIENFKQKHEDLEQQIKQLEKLNEDLGKSNSQLKETLENEKGNNEKQISQLKKLEQSDSEDSIKTKVQELEYRLSKEKNKCLTISREKDELINKLKEIEEKYSLMEIKLENLQSEKTECNILQLKLQKLEEEHELLNIEYENQKELTEEIKKNKKVIKKIERDYASLNEQYENERINNEFSSQKLLKLEEEIIRKTEESKIILQEFIKSNKIITLAKEEKEKEVLELSSKLSNLVNTVEKQNVEFYNLLIKTGELNAAIDNVRTEKYIQEQLNSKIGQLEKELCQKSQQIVTLTQNLSELENVCKEEKTNADKRTEECRGEYVRIEAELNNYLKAKDNELSILDNEITSLRSEIETLKRENSDNILQLKLQKLKKDYEQLQQAKEFAVETLKENKKVIEILENDCAMVSEQYENEKRNNELSNQKLQELEQKIKRKYKKKAVNFIEQYKGKYERIEAELKAKDNKISILHNEKSKYNSLQLKLQQLETDHEQFQQDKEFAQEI